MSVQKALEIVVPSGHGEIRLLRSQAIPVEGGQLGCLHHQ